MKVNATTPTYEAPTFTGSVTWSKSITEWDTLSVIAPVNSPSGAYTCTQKGTNSPKLSSLVVSSVSGWCKVEWIINIVWSYSYQIEACLNAEPTKCTSYIVDGIEVNAVVTPPFIPSMPNINDVTVTPNFAWLIIWSIEKTWTTINVTAENDHTTNLVLSISLPSNYSFNSSSEQANTSVTSPRNYGLTPDMQTILVYQKNPSTWDYESVGNITVNIQWQ
jgi:hypothetical protein